MKIFGTSGIRGVVNERLTPRLALEVGMAVAATIPAGRAVVGYDSRVSSPMLKQALSAGLLASGVNILELGMVPTPLCAYMTKVLGGQVGLMVTASHNPPEYNGIKLFNRDTLTYTEAQQTTLESIIIKKKFTLPLWDKVGKARLVEGVEPYLERASAEIPNLQGWTVVLDPGNGAASIVAPELLRRLGCRVISVNAQPDGFFPGRPPEPTPQTLKETSRLVVAMGANVGFAYDGDGDRMVVIDERGIVEPLDVTLAAYAAYVVRKGGRGKVVTHVEASRCVDEAVEGVKGRVVRCKVGDVNVAAALKEEGAVFGGEPSGAWIHPEFHLCPDGIYSSVKYLAMLASEKLTPSEATKALPRYPIIRRNLACAEGIKEAVMRRLPDLLSKAFHGHGDISHADGMRLNLPRGWLLVRASGTEPLLRLTVEAEGLKEAENIAERALKVLKTIEEKLSEGGSVSGG